MSGNSLAMYDPATATTLQSGVASRDHGMVERHPVETIQKTAVARAEQEEFKRLQLIHGAHAPLRMKMERLALSQIPGHNGLNTFGLETVMGRNHSFDFEDYLGLEQFRPEMDRLSFHQAMERRLRM